MQVVEVVPGLYIGTKIVPPAEYASLGVDAIVDLEAWDYAWVPRVPTGSIYLSFPLADGDDVDTKLEEVAAFIAALVHNGQQVLVHCTEGLNRAGLVVAQTLVELGHAPEDAIGLVRRRRGRSIDGFEALSNERFVAWLLGEPPADVRT